MLKKMTSSCILNEMNANLFWLILNFLGVNMHFMSTQRSKLYVDFMLSISYLGVFTSYLSDNSERIFSSFSYDIVVFVLLH